MVLFSGIKTRCFLYKRKIFRFFLNKNYLATLRYDSNEKKTTIDGRKHCVRTMILEELVGSFVSLFSRVIIQAPGISRENLHSESGSLENSEQSEVCYGLIHREYDDQRAPTELQYDQADDISHLVQADEQPRRSFCESILRSLKANIGLITVVIFILPLVTIACILVGLATTDYCIDWILHKNLTLPQNVGTVEIAAVSFVLLLLFSWFPTCVALCFGFKEFRKNYLLDLFVLQLVTESSSTLYDIYFSHQLFTVRDIDYTKYRLANKSQNWLWFYNQF